MLSEKDKTQFMILNEVLDTQVQITDTFVNLLKWELDIANPLQLADDTVSFIFKVIGNCSIFGGPIDSAKYYDLTAGYEFIISNFKLPASDIDFLVQLVSDTYESIKQHVKTQLMDNSVEIYGFPKLNLETVRSLIGLKLIELHS
nr:hypothetical protein [Pedobacter panaciterrae]